MSRVKCELAEKLSICSVDASNAKVGGEASAISGVPHYGVLI